ncbi:hypothetical protein EB796_014418 [Bugula neritina]|uniref:Uncharacterized protein n=1 Tax=Bugula neritina TaxID=10212 RepID=A0A7J7JLM9_BUGNE|nr:hypothetical protein EB796_014418 [Bugula neritina]
MTPHTLSVWGDVQKIWQDTPLAPTVSFGADAKSEEWNGFMKLENLRMVGLAESSSSYSTPLSCLGFCILKQCVYVNFDKERKICEIGRTKAYYIYNENSMHYYIH